MVTTARFDPTPQRFISASRGLLRAGFVVSALAAAACNLAEEDPSECAGQVGCECVQGQFCEVDLVCNAGVCLPDGATGDGGSDPTGGAGDDESGSDDGSSSDPNGPQIINLVTSLSTMTEGDVMTITAIVTDPDGIADVIGGNLTDVDGTVTYGAFMTAGDEGSYHLEISWADIHQVNPIELQGPQTRSFRVTFFDVEAHETYEQLSIELTCGDLVWACDGVCTDTVSNLHHCGACNKECTSNDCNQGVCEPAWGDCIAADDQVYANCGEYCASRGLECLPACTGYPQGTTGASSDDNRVQYFDSFLSSCGHQNYYAQAFADPCETPFRWGESGLGVGEFVSAECCCGG